LTLRDAPPVSARSSVHISATDGTIRFQARSLPIRIGIGVPIFFRNAEREPYVGGILRVMLELDRD